MEKNNMTQLKADQIFKPENKTKDQKTSDGFKNLALKLGITSNGEDRNDNAISDGTYGFNLVTRNRVKLEAAYRGSWIVGRVVDSVAEDMTKAGIMINTNEGAEQLQEFKVMMSRLQIWQSLAETVKWGRLYGGAIAVMQIEGQKLDSPLNLDSVQKDQFKGLVVYDRWQLQPSLENLIEQGPNMGLPAYYDIVLGSNLNDPSHLPGGQEAKQQSGRVRVHHSRCARLGGHKLPFFQAITENMWEESVIERLWDRLIEFDTATASAGSLITRANLRTVGVNGLREILAAGGEAQEALLEMFEYMRKFQSNEGLTLLDKEDVFASTAYSFAGLSDIIIQFGQQVSGSCEIPLVRLFGQSPAGLSATGESDIRNYYDSINAKQEAHLRNPLEMVVKVLWRSMTGNPAPKDLSFVFTPLWQMSAMDKATIAQNNTNSIIAAHDAGGIDTQTMMKELKQMSGDTGLFSHITDEQIEEAEGEEPPVAELGTPEKEGEGTGDPGEGPTEPLKKKAGDSAWMKIKKFLAPKPKAKLVKDEKPKKVKVTDEQKAIRDWLKK